jgi:hypothetical protein
VQGGGGWERVLQFWKFQKDLFSFFYTESREQLKSKVQGMLQFLKFQKRFSAFFYKIERAVEIKGAGGASVFCNFPKILQFFSFFYKIERAVEIKVCRNLVLLCKDTIQKIPNKYSQKRNCAASVPTFL